MRDLAAAVSLGFNGGDPDQVFPLRHARRAQPLTEREGWDDEAWWRAGTGEGYGEGAEAN